MRCVVCGNECKKNIKYCGKCGAFSPCASMFINADSLKKWNAEISKKRQSVQSSTQTQNTIHMKDPGAEPGVNKPMTEEAIEYSSPENSIIVEEDAQTSNVGCSWLVVMLGFILIILLIIALWNA